MERRLGIALCLALATLAGIFLLAQQSVKETSDLTWRVEQLLVRIIPPTGTGPAGEPTWLGLTIRRLAHVVEYAVLGLTTSLVVMQFAGATGRAAAYTAAICFAASLADELHKVFVPGRHFDAQDLALDAVGYMLAMMLAFGAARLLTHTA